MRWSRAQEARSGAAAQRVLGVDPGTVATGWGVVEVSGTGVRYVASGVVRPRGERADRLVTIFRAAREVCERYAPAALSIEQMFVGDNIQTAFRLGEARGVIMLAAAEAGLGVAEYSPAEIKIAVAGSGRAAKEQIQAMVGRLLGLDTAFGADEADALGAAICHLQTSRFAALVSAQLPAGVRFRTGRRAATR